MKAAMVEAATMCMSNSGEFSIRKRAEWPTAAIIAQNRYAFLGGLLIDANPIAAIAANSASCIACKTIAEIFKTYLYSSEACLRIIQAKDNR